MSVTLELLLKKYDGRVMLPLKACVDAGIAYQTARHKLQNGSFTIKTSKIGKKHVIHIADLADYIDQLSGRVATEAAMEAPADPPARGRGRPKLGVKGGEK